MEKETKKIKDENILTVKVKVNSRIDAYAIVSELGFDYNVLSAEFNGKKETFGKDNHTSQFLKNNSKIKKEFRDIRAERKLK